MSYAFMQLGHSTDWLLDFDPIVFTFVAGLPIYISH